MRPSTTAKQFQTFSNNTIVMKKYTNKILGAAAIAVAVFIILSITLYLQIHFRTTPSDFQKECKYSSTTEMKMEERILEEVPDTTEIESTTIVNND